MMKTNRVFGIIGLGAKMANWNADFTTRPKSLPDGTIFGSDVSIKRAYRDAFYDMDKTVFYKKAMTFDEMKKKSKTATIEEKFEMLFGKEPSDRREVLVKLMEAVDVRTFGVLYTSKNNIGYKGTVQFTQGLNFDEETEVVIQDITSTFRTGDKNESASIGKKVFTDEAHYLYNFAIDPAENREFINNGWLTEDEVFSEEDYETFKEASKFCATRINTAAKVACYNEFSLFVEFKNGSNKYLTDLASLINVKRGKNKTIYNISNLLSSLNDSPIASHIDKVEVFVETNKVDLVTEDIQPSFDLKIKSIFE